MLVLKSILYNVSPEVSTKIMFAKILLPIAFEPLDYQIPDGITLDSGDLVSVPFRRGQSIGLVVGQQETTHIDLKKIKPIQQKLAYSLDEETCSFMGWMAKYTCAPLGLIFKMFLGRMSSKQLGEEGVSGHPSLFHYEACHLNADQNQVAEQFKEAVQAHQFAPMVLDGVTGSGKTEVYFEAIQACLEQKKTALVLLPEINLTSGWLARFEKRFGALPVQWHSHLTPKQRKEAWHKVACGAAPVVVGTRSALCLPHQNLGVIVVDEEHDASFKQETQVRYHARDMAVRRAQMAACPVILSSATPSVETQVNVQEGKYRAYALPVRYGAAQLPEMQAIDLRKEALARDTYISETLWRALEENKERGEQSLLFLNRRGFAPVVICRSCGDAQACLLCDVGLVYHQKKERLVCHHCGYTCSVTHPCLSCEAPADYVFFGPGVEKIQQEVERRQPAWRTLLMTSDTLTTGKKVAESFAQIERGEVDVIVATQTMAKGHHFPNLTLVGVIDATLGHVDYDLRVTERAYQVLHQVAGRSGRAGKKGHVYLQTYQPDQEAFQALCAHDRDAFFHIELAKRQQLGLPPYGRLTALIVEGAKEEMVQRVAKHLARNFPTGQGVELYGPVAAPLARLNKTHRWRLLLKSQKVQLHQSLLSKWLGAVEIPPSVRLHVDVDPYSFL